MNKSLKSILALSVATVFALSACKKSDSTTTEVIDDVKLNVTTSLAEGKIAKDAKNIITVTSSGNAKNALKSLKFNVKVSSLSKDTVITLSGTSSTFTDTLDMDLADMTYTLTFTLTGEKGNAATKVLTYTTVSFDKTNVSVYSGARANGTYAQFMDAQSFTPYYFAGSSGAKYNASKIDLGFFYGSTNKATFFSPSTTDASILALYDDSNVGIQTWPVRNNTLIKKSTLTAAQFDAMMSDLGKASDIISQAATLASTDLVANQIADNDVLVYKTNRAGVSKVGLIRIVKVNVNADLTKSYMEYKAIYEL